MIENTLPFLSIIIPIAILLIILLFKRFSKGPLKITSKHRLVKTIQASNEEILKAMKTSNFTKCGYNSNEKTFYGETKTSWLSWGECIEIKINDNKLEFLSYCSVPSTIFDYGKNKKNAKKFFTELEKIKD